VNFHEARNGIGPSRYAHWALRANPGEIVRGVRKVTSPPNASLPVGAADAHQRSPNAAWARWRVSESVVRLTTRPVLTIGCATVHAP
jgi:hypothetical protein